MSKPRFRVPHTLVLLLGMILLAQVLSYVLPQGEYERTMAMVGESEREVVVPESYAPVEQRVSLRVWHALTAIPRGFEDAQDVIFFVFIVGGAFGVFRATGAADALIGSVLRHMGSRPTALIVAGIALFMVGSSTIGMAEEYLPFVPVLMTLCIALGYDAVTAVAIMTVGYAIGYGAAVINPFTVIIAQNVAGVEPSSGIGFRLILSVVFLVVGVHHVLRYANKVKADPATSLVADIEPDASTTEVHEVKMEPRHVGALVAIIATIGLLVWGIKVHGWYMEAMGAIFLGLTILLGALGGLGLDGTAKKFCSGAAEFTSMALLIGFARTIKTVLDDGQIIDTIIHGISGPLQSAGAYVSAVGMYFVQSACNLFIPSGSGQAYVTMPIMAPLADLSGVSRQVAVLAYQFGDGFTNILVPTNAVLIGILAMAKIPYERWLRFILPFMIKVWIVGSLALVVAVATGYQ